MLLQRFTWCFLLYERWVFYDWLYVLTAECTFTNCGWQSTHTGRLRWWSVHLPTSSVHYSRPSWSDGYSDRPPAFQWLVRAATRTTAANQAESEKIALYSSLSSKIDYRLLMVKHTLSFADYGCQTSSTLNTQSTPIQGTSGKAVTNDLVVSINLIKWCTHVQVMYVHMYISSSSTSSTKLYPRSLPCSAQLSERSSALGRSKVEFPCRQQCVEVEEGLHS